MRVNAEHLDQVLHPQFINKSKALTKGLAASPGAAVGKVYFTADDAEAAAKSGEAVILVRSETSPEDVHGMMVAKGILTSRGGLVSHAAVVLVVGEHPQLWAQTRCRLKARRLKLAMLLCVKAM